MSASDFNQMEREKCVMVVNGQKMTVKAYQEQKRKSRQKEQTKKKNEVRTKMIQQLSPYVTKLIKNVKVLKSAASYYDNGYKHWGRKVMDCVINHPTIQGSFLKYRMTAYEMASLVDQIDKIGRKNEKDIFQFIEKLSYKVDDAKTHLYQLVRDVSDSRVCEFYADEKFIKETGKVLGLSILMQKALASMSEIENLIDELTKIAGTGVDVFDYNANNNKRYYIR